MAIEGPLRELGIHDVFQLLDLSRKTGVLRVSSELREDEGLVVLRRRPRRAGDDSKQGDVDGARAAPGRTDQRGRSRARRARRTGPRASADLDRPARRDRRDHAEGARAAAAAAHRERRVRADVVARRVLLVRGAGARRHAGRLAHQRLDRIAAHGGRAPHRRVVAHRGLVPNPGVIPELAPVERGSRWQGEPAARCSICCRTSGRC